MIGAAAMSLSSFFVVSNALRLNMFKPDDASHDKSLKVQAAVNADGRLLGSKDKADDDSSNGASAVKADKADNSDNCRGGLEHNDNSCCSSSNSGSICMNDSSIADNNKEEDTMQKTINIDGMMCHHCEMAVQKALEALDNVRHAEVSHEKGTAVVDLSADVPNDVLKKAVEDKDYTVKSIA